MSKPKLVSVQISQQCKKGVVRRDITLVKVTSIFCYNLYKKLWPKKQTNIKVNNVVAVGDETFYPIHLAFTIFFGGKLNTTSIFDG